MTRCSYCGAELRPNSRYCLECGQLAEAVLAPGPAPVEPGVAAPPAPPAPPVASAPPTVPSAPAPVRVDEVPLAPGGGAPGVVAAVQEGLVDGSTVLRRRDRRAATTDDEPPAAGERSGTEPAGPPAPVTGGTTAEPEVALTRRSLRRREEEAAAARTPLTDEPAAVPLVQALLLRVSTGEVVTVSGSAIVGRRPEEAARNSGAQAVRVDDPARSVSRVHLFVDVAGGRATVRDAGSGNGSSLEREGRRQPLTEATPTALRAGDRLWIGDVSIDVATAG